MTYDEILSRFSRRKKSGNGWDVQCPAHDDQHASLSVSRGSDDRTLLHCHAGCAIDDVVRAMGLTTRDLFFSPRSDVIYDYTDEQGNLLFQVLRTAGKNFRQRRPNGKGWTWSVKGVRRVLYRLPDVITADTVYVVEGEKDADALAAHGLVATTAPGGAGRWHQSYTETLRGKRVIILPDRDEPGAKHAHIVAKSLPDARTIWLPLTEKGADVSDWIAAGGDPKTIIDLPDGEPPRQTPTEPSRTDIAAALKRGDPSDHILRMVAGVKSFGEREEVLARVCAERGLPKVQARSHVQQLAQQRAQERGSVIHSRNDYGLDLDGLNWTLTSKGVYPLTCKQGVWEPLLSRPAATRPIYPAASGIDAATGEPYVLLRWDNPSGEQWVPESHLRDKAALSSLPGAPVSLGRILSLSDYLVDVTPRAPAKNTITSRMGWVGGQWIWRHSKFCYVGPQLDDTGDIKIWRKGMATLIDQGPHGYPALACLAASAGAPLVRVVGRRNPILALTYRTSSGKGSAIGYALSVWMPPHRLTIPASSTIKGTQDLAHAFPDLPLFADEIHQLRGDNIAKLLYYLGNGQRRVTSSRTQVAVGGERRWGVGYIASESHVLESQHGGVGMRAISINGKPCLDAETALLLQQSARASGAPGDIISRSVHDAVATLHDHERELVRDAGDMLQGDDVSSLAVMWTGGEMLSQAVGMSMSWVRPTILWLLSHHISVRSARSERAESAWNAMIDVVLHGLRTDTTSGATWELVREPVAWLIWDGHTGYLEIHTRHPRVVQALADYGGEQALLADWRERGWIIPYRDGRPKWMRRGHGRVIRSALSAPGLEPDDLVGQSDGREEVP